jgi:UDP-N-acetylmuramate dehydrogenase
MNRNGEISEIYLPEHEFGYRKSIFSKNGLIILETTIKLYYGNKAEIKEKMDEYRNKRIKNQPLEFPNAGSTFKRNNDIPVAKLIDECGLKGYRICGAEVSTKHAGFIINSNHATANDILKLVEYVQKEVKSKFDIDIELEIIVLGEK